MAIEDHRRWLTRSHRRLFGALRRLLRRFEPKGFHQSASNVAWNRTLAAIEEEVMPHVEHPQLDVGSCDDSRARVPAFRAARERSCTGYAFAAARLTAWDHTPRIALSAKPFMFGMPRHCEQLQWPA